MTANGRLRALGIISLVTSLPSPAIGAGATERFDTCSRVRLEDVRLQFLEQARYEKAAGLFDQAAIDCSGDAEVATFATRMAARARRLEVTWKGMETEGAKGVSAFLSALLEDDSPCCGAPHSITTRVYKRQLENDPAFLAFVETMQPLKCQIETPAAGDTFAESNAFIGTITDEARGAGIRVEFGQNVGRAAFRAGIDEPRVTQHGGLSIFKATLTWSLASPTKPRAEVSGTVEGSTVDRDPRQARIHLAERLGRVAMEAIRRGLLQLHYGVLKQKKGRR